MQRCLTRPMTRRFFAAAPLTRSHASQRALSASNGLLSRATRRCFASDYPDHQLLGLPALSPTMEKGNIVQWLKAEGDEIAAGDIVAEIETDKAVMELEAQDDVVLAKVLVPAGAQDIAVGAPIAVTVDEADDVAAFANFVVSEAGASAPPASEPAAAAAAAPSQPPAQQGSALPDDFELLGMPALSPTMTQGNIVSWNLKEGDEIVPGEIIAEIETDKAVMEMEAQDEGILAKILKPDGSEGVQVGQPIAVISDDTDIDISAVKDFVASDAPAAAAAPAAETPAPAAAAATPATPAAAATPKAPLAPGERVNISPYARRLLTAAGVAPAALAPGSGPNGRIIASDVESADLNALKAGVAPAAATTSAQITADGEYDVIPHTNIRRITAQRLTESKQQVPHYYLTMEMRVDKILDVRARLAEAGGPKPSLNDFVIRASAAALRQVPEVNASWSDDSILQYHNVDIAVAVATDSGLITPIVQDADCLGVNQISSTMRELAGRARDNKLKPHEFQGGTFTISNLGMYGIKQFTAIINPPQAAILAVGSVEKRVVPGADNSVETHSILTVTMSCDHRVIDGAVGATWLQAFKRCMEDPVNMVL